MRDVLAIRGARSKIAQEVARVMALSSVETRPERVPRGSQIPVDCSRYLFTAGVLFPRNVATLAPEELFATWEVNHGSIVRDCDDILARNDEARIVVIGSESAYRGSFNEAYAAAKAGVHRYVELKQLRPQQQLVCVSPSIIADSGMTIRRTDQDRLTVKKEAHPKKRFVTTTEVARLVFHLLFVDQGYISGTVVRMHGANQ